MESALELLGPPRPAPAFSPTWRGGRGRCAAAAAPTRLQPSLCVSCAEYPTVAWKGRMPERPRPPRQLSWRAIPARQGGPGRSVTSQRRPLSSDTEHLGPPGSPQVRLNLKVQGASAAAYPRTWRGYSVQLQPLLRQGAFGAFPALCDYGKKPGNPIPAALRCRGGWETPTHKGGTEGRRTSSPGLPR